MVGPRILDSACRAVIDNKPQVRRKRGVYSHIEIHSKTVGLCDLHLTGPPARGWMCIPCVNRPARVAAVGPKIVNAHVPGWNRRIISWPRGRKLLFCTAWKALR